MRRTLLLAGALTVLAATPAHAGVTGHKTGQDPDAVRAYWTPQRMAEARALDRHRGDAATKARPGTGTTQTWSTTAVSWPATESILNAHGKVFFSIGTSNYVCSGTAVGTNVVWTAGHCVNEGPGTFYTNFMFVPSYNANGVREPYGRFTADTLYTTTQWQTQANAYGYDLGAGHLGTNAAGQTLGAALHGNLRTIDFTPPAYTATGFRVKSYGYPAEGKFTGQTEYLCDTYVDRRDTSASPPDYGIPCGMNGGSSGGGWVDPLTDQVISVNSYGYSTIKNEMFGPTIGAEGQTLYNAANH